MPEPTPLTAEQLAALDERCTWYEERGRANQDATFSVAAVRALLTARERLAAALKAERTKRGRADA